ncbi:olfactory receptor 6E1-like [Caloenas nicobarica]|uniref:olfactory receptor 6E1-like n=1 Tax=Caloenas nicobarica TaxID=187106 RepID=UPI0032B8682A
MFLSRHDEPKFNVGSENETAVTEFILEGFSGLDQRLQLLLSLVFLLIYLTTVMGNATIIFLVYADRRLQTPMYFFIGNLAFLEIWFTSSTSIKLVVILGSGRRTISLSSCFAQSASYFTLGCTELILLVVMSFDRYVAICQPLHYAAIMKPQLYIHLVVATWVTGFTLFSYRLVILSQLTFCGSNEIHHFFCVSLENSRFVALLNTVLYPFLNPFIYSLRNKAVILALNEAIARTRAQLFP